MPIFYLEPFEEQTNHPRWAASSLREACWVVAPSSYRARIKVGTATLTEGCWVTKDAEERRRMSPEQKNRGSPWMNAYLTDSRPDDHPPVDVPEGVIVSVSGKLIS